MEPVGFGNTGVSTRYAQNPPSADTGEGKGGDEWQREGRDDDDYMG